MGKWGIVVAACIVLWSAATSAKNEDELDMIFFDVCVSCDTILPRAPAVDPDGWRAAEKALEEALDSATLRSLARGSIITVGRRIRQVVLYDRTSLRVIASRERDGRFDVLKYDSPPAPPAAETKPVPPAAPAAPTAETKAPHWQLHDSVDRFDGARTVAVTAVAEGGLDGALTVRCVNNKTDLVIGWPRPADRSGQVQWRLDDRPAQSQSWQLSREPRALFAVQPIALVKQMFAAREFAVRTKPDGATQQTLSFKLAGLAEAIAPVRKACGW